MVRHERDNDGSPENHNKNDSSGSQPVGQDGEEGYCSSTRNARKKRRRRDSNSADRGLPADAGLRDLARVYLETQRELWPEISDDSILSPPSTECLEEMVADFKRRHRGELEERHRPLLDMPGIEIGASYSRYSCDNSNPRSIADQLVIELRKACDERQFIPWSHVFADFSISGLDPSRQGFNSLKKMLSKEACVVHTVYIDDFTRASRDEAEWWKLARFARRHRKRLVGASDGFDLNSENADLLLSVYSIVSRQFIKSLRQKVRRGMQGAARRGTSLGRLALGYQLRPAKDRVGNAVLGKDGESLHEPCIDPATSAFVRLAFEMYGLQKKTLFQIAKYFNQIEVDGGKSWSTSSIEKVLTNLSYIGIRIFNRTRQEMDPETGKVTILPNPRKEWIVKKAPHLRIIDNDLWKIVWRRFKARHAADPRTGRKLSRNQHCASTLFSGTLVCGYCGKEIVLMRSGKYKVMACTNGRTCIHGCQLSSSKSVVIIEECLLGYLRSHLITEAAVRQLIVLGNKYLSEEAAKPRVETAPLHAKVKDVEARIRKLTDLIEEEPDHDACRAYHLRVSRYEKQRRELLRQVRAAEGQNRPPPKPITLTDIERYLSDLRDLLNKEIPAAAEVLRELTGVIKITQEPHTDGKRGARWIATFQPNLGRLLTRAARERLYLV